MVNVFESTLEGTSGEVIVSSGIGSQTPCFSLDSASGYIAFANEHNESFISLNMYDIHVIYTKH